MDEGEIFDLKKKCIHYNKLDYVAQSLILYKMYQPTYQITGLSIFDYITGCGLFYQYILENSIPNSIGLCEDRSVDAHIRNPFCLLFGRG